MAQAVNFVKKVNGKGDFKTTLNYKESFMIEEIRISIISTSNRYRKAYFSGYIKSKGEKPVNSSPIYKIFSAKFRANAPHRQEYRYALHTKCCPIEYLYIRGDRLKYTKYTITIMGYKMDCSS